MKGIPLSILDRIETCIQRYKLANRGEALVVAASGGKDSTLLALSFRELEYTVFPVAIDMGYSSGWASRVHSLFSRNGFDILVFPVRSKTTEWSLPQTTRHRINRHFRVLDTLDSIPGFVTPCTHCYNVKALSLFYSAQQIGANAIAFGHHATDALASLVKSALMYIDRWDGGNTTFSRLNFQLLIDSISNQWHHGSGACPDPILERISHLVNSDKAGTDEPPTQDLMLAATPPIHIVRPLFTLRESEIREVFTRLNLQVEGSDCGHGATQLTQTPREMVHWRILAVLEANSDPRGIWSHLWNTLLTSITADGRSRVNVRHARQRLLGSLYKDAGDLSTKL